MFVCTNEDSGRGELYYLLATTHYCLVPTLPQEVHALVRTTAEEAHRELTKTEVKLRETEGKLRGEMSSSLTDVRAAMETKIGADCEAVRKQVPILCKR
jgi:hypothetical protein